MNLDYKEKYLKYKNKYLLAKAQQGGNLKLLQLFNSELFKTLSDTDLEKIIKSHYENEDHQKLIISKAKILKKFLIEFNLLQNNLKNHFFKTEFIVKIKNLILDTTMPEKLFIDEFNILSGVLKQQLLLPLEIKLKEDLFKVFTGIERLKKNESISEQIYKISKEFIDSELFKQKLNYLVACYVGKADTMPVLLQLPIKTINPKDIETQIDKPLVYGSKIIIKNKENGKREEITVIEVDNDNDTVFGINSIYFHLYNLQIQNGSTLKDYFFQKILSLLFDTTIQIKEFIDIAKTIVIKKEEQIEYFL